MERSFLSFCNVSARDHLIAAILAFMLSNFVVCWSFVLSAPYMDGKHVTKGRTVELIPVAGDTMMMMKVRQGSGKRQLFGIQCSLSIDELHKICRCQGDWYHQRTIWKIMKGDKLCR